MRKKQKIFFYCEKRHIFVANFANFKNKYGCQNPLKNKLGAEPEKPNE